MDKLEAVLGRLLDQKLALAATRARSTGTRRPGPGGPDDIYAQAGVPARYRGLDSSSMRRTNGLRAVLAWLETLHDRLSEGRGLILQGPVGTGKSAAAALVVMRCADMGIPAWFCDCTDILADLSAVHALGHTNKFDALAWRLGRADVLVLDDVGQERGDSWAQDQLEAIIARRYASLRPTVITTNFTRDQLSGRYGERIIDRLAQNSQIVVFSGKSLRRPESL